MVGRRIAVRSFTLGWLRVTVYENTYESKTYLDTVIYRLVGRGPSAEWRRGANMKPRDLPVLVSLIQRAIAYIADHPRHDAVPATHKGTEVDAASGRERLDDSRR